MKVDTLFELNAFFYVQKFNSMWTPK